MIGLERGDERVARIGIDRLDDHAVSDPLVHLGLPGGGARRLRREGREGDKKKRTDRSSERVHGRPTSMKGAQNAGCGRSASCARCAERTRAAADSRRPSLSV